jgi:hypothetical protein
MAHLNGLYGAFPRTWSFNPSRDGFRFSFPHRLPIAISAVLAVTPWIRQIRCHFTLRTLLIAMTLFALLIGLVVYASR